MVTKEQAMTATLFIQIGMATPKGQPYMGGDRIMQDYDLYVVEPLPKPRNWRASGKCKTWKTRPDEFKLPIKYGLYQSSYLTHENAHLFKVAE